MFEKLGFRNNMIRLVKSNFSIYRICLTLIMIFYEIESKPNSYFINTEYGIYKIIIRDVMFLVLVPLIISIILMVIIYLKDKIDNENIQEGYYRDIIKEVTPVELSYVDDYTIELENDIVATLLELQLKRKIEFRDQKIVVVDNTLSNDLSFHEKYILHGLITKNIFEKDNIYNKYGTVRKEILQHWKKFKKDIKKQEQIKIIFILIIIMVLHALAGDNGPIYFAFLLFGTVYFLIKKLTNRPLKKKKTMSDEFSETIIKDLKRSNILKKEKEETGNKYQKFKNIFICVFTMIFIIFGSGDEELIYWFLVFNIYIIGILLIIKAVKKPLRKIKPILTVIKILVLGHATVFVVLFTILLPELINDNQELIILVFKHLLLIAAIIFIVSEFYIIINKRELSKKGKELKSKLLGIKLFLKDYSDMKSKGLNEVNLWDEYIIYAVILNNNKKIKKEIKKCL